MPQNPSGPCGKNEDSGLENGCPIAAWLATGYGGVSWEWNICNIAVGGVVVVIVVVFVVDSGWCWCCVSG